SIQLLWEEWFWDSILKRGSFPFCHRALTTLEQTSLDPAFGPEFWPLVFWIL
ncbi:1452_t:CDS:1, partial [Acaulospora colombiana]